MKAAEIMEIMDEMTTGEYPMTEDQIFRLCQLAEEPVVQALSKEEILELTQKYESELQNPILKELDDLLFEIWWGKDEFSPS